MTKTIRIQNMIVIFFYGIGHRQNYRFSRIKKLTLLQ